MGRVDGRDKHLRAVEHWDKARAAPSYGLDQPIKGSLCKFEKRDKHAE
jgi:hypothetical protein